VRKQATVEALVQRLKQATSVTGLLSYKHEGELYTLGKVVITPGKAEGEFFFKTDPESVSGTLYVEDGHLYVIGIDR